MRLDTDQPLVWTLDDVFSAEECAKLVVRSESHGFEPAPITTASGFEMRPDIRNNTRVMFDDAGLAKMLFDRVKASLPAKMFGRRAPVGANERFRFYRYQPGQQFRRHYDGAFVRNVTEESLLSLIVYLNDDFEGGTTDFIDLPRRIDPKRGRALMFQHQLLHEGSAVRSGVKYVARSDVMYASL